MTYRKITRIISFLMVLSIMVGILPDISWAVPVEFVNEGDYSLSSNEKKKAYTPQKLPSISEVYNIGVNFVFYTDGKKTSSPKEYFISGGRYERTYQKPAGYRLESIELTKGMMQATITPNKANGRVLIDLNTPGISRKPTPKDTEVEITYVYKKDEPINNEPVIANNSKPTSKHKTGTKAGDTTYAVSIDNYKASGVPARSEEDVLKDQLAYASKVWKGIAVSVAEYFASAGALPSGIDYRTRIQKGKNSVTNSIGMLTGQEIEDFRNKIGKVQLDRNILAALNASIDSAYEKHPGHPAMSNKHRYAFTGEQEKFNFKTDKGMVFQQLPFLYGMNQLRTLVTYSDTPLDKNSVTKREVGYTLSGEVLTNMLFRDDITSSGDYSTRTFKKDPMSEPSFRDLLNRNGIKVNATSGKLLKEVAKDNKQWSLQIINSAIAGINTMVDESGFRPWMAEETFNYWDTSLTEETKKVLTPRKIEGWENCLVIMEYPTDYTWGYGIMGTMGGTYTTVPLKPFLGTYDLKIVEKETSAWDSERQSYITAFEYSLDKMPYLPDEMSKFVPLISVGIEKGIIKGTTLNTAKDMTLIAGEGVIYAGGALKGEFSVEWTPDKDLPEDKKALLYASVDLLNVPGLKVLETVAVSDESKELVSSIKTRGEVVKFNPKGFSTNISYYGWYEEKTHTNNIAYLEKGMPPVDLYVNCVDGAYEKSKETLTITGKVGLAEGFRKLDKAKGELPVELEITWETALYNCKCSRFC